MIEKGQAVIWAANLLHGGAPQKDRERTRHSQVTHYFFEGCKNFAPLLSSPSRRFYIRPTWIRQRPPTKLDTFKRMVNNVRLLVRSRVAPFRLRAKG